MVGVPTEPLIGSGRVTEELHRAAAEGELETVVRLIGLGATVDSCDQNGATPLQKAACGGHIQVVQHLLKKCANVDHQDSQHGNTALHEASWKGYSQTAECLVKAKSNVYLKNQGGFAPLHLACQNGHNQTCRVLLLAGCRPDIKNNYGDTPIHTAARYGHAGVTRILLSARADVKETNKNGDTGLHIAAAMGRRKLTRMLLEADADQTIKNKQGETPSDIAIRKDFHQILDILRNPPKVLTIDERLRQEQHQKREEANTNKERGKKDKKREKMNDSGTSSKESGTKHKEKKKMKGNIKIDPKTRSARLSSWGVDWSPYGCHVAPPTDNAIVPPKLDSLPADPLIRGEQYYVDLAGNIRKGPVGIGSTCFCAPLFQNVQNKMEKDKNDLMDHIDQAHVRLNDRISSLESHTKGHIQKLGQTVQEKELATERAECRAQNCRLKESQESEMDRKVVQLQSWIERRLSNHHPDSPSSTRRRMRDSLNRTHPLTRSRSEEAISEIRGDNSDNEEPLYKGLRVLDHPTSMYNIPHNIDMESEPCFYDYTNPVQSLSSAGDIASRTDKRQYLQSLFDPEQRNLPQNGYEGGAADIGFKSRNVSEGCLNASSYYKQRTESDLIRPRTRGPLIVDSVNNVNGPDDKTDGAIGLLLDEAVGNLNVSDKVPINTYVSRNGQISRYDQLHSTDQPFRYFEHSSKLSQEDNTKLIRKYDVDISDGIMKRRNLPTLSSSTEFSKNALKLPVEQLNQSRGNSCYPQERVNRHSCNFSDLNGGETSVNIAEASQTATDRFRKQTPDLSNAPHSRYNFRNNNPYMYNLRGNTNADIPQLYFEGNCFSPQSDLEGRLSQFGQNVDVILPVYSSEERSVISGSNLEGRPTPYCAPPDEKPNEYGDTPDGLSTTYCDTSDVRRTAYSATPEGRPITYGATPEGRPITYGATPEGRPTTYGATPEGKPSQYSTFVEGTPNAYSSTPEGRFTYGITPHKPPLPFNLPPTQTYHASVLYNSPENCSTYLDMDRFRIQAAVKKLYDGYLADGRMEAPRPSGKMVLETSTEHDSHNDSGYSTRLCSASQGHSPALPVVPHAVGREDTRTNGADHEGTHPPQYHEGTHPPQYHEGTHPPQYHQGTHPPQYLYYNHHHPSWRLNGRYSENEPSALAPHNNASSSLNEGEASPVINGTDGGVRSPPHRNNGGVFIGESSLV